VVSLNLAHPVLVLKLCTVLCFYFFSSLFCHCIILCLYQSLSVRLLPLWQINIYNDKFLMRNPMTELRGATCHLWDHTVLLATRHKRTYPLGALKLGHVTLFLTKFDPLPAFSPLSQTVTHGWTPFPYQKYVTGTIPPIVCILLTLAT